MSDLLAVLAADRERDYRRLVLVSALLHVALAVIFALRMPSFDRPTDLPAVVSLVPASALAPPKPAAKTPAPKAAAKPVPPKPPELAKTVIPVDNQKKPKAKPKPEPEPEERPEPEKPRQPEDVDLDEFLEQLREELPPGPVATGEPAAKPVQGPSGPGVLVTPEVLAWMEKVKTHVRRRWGHDPRFRGKSLSTDVLVTLTASGDVLDFEITRRSGNPWYDESVERFLLKETPLPPPPKGGDWPIRFTPGDLL
jgi:TonB family protein